LSDVAAKLRAIVERVRRNVPHRRDPERFHIEKSCLWQDLERIADALDFRQNPSWRVDDAPVGAAREAI
jgi:hypothetical protein